MRGFIILGALTTLARAAEMPATAGAKARTKYYMYESAQKDAPDANLPTAWTATHCTSGTKQSPIDIVSKSATVEKVDPGAINMTGYDIDLTGSLVNDGRQITYTPTSPAFKPSIYGGALPAGKNYVFDHLEFKFGKDKTSGSEHTMDAKKYPMEIQLVHYEAKLTTTTVASTATAGIVVLSFFVEATATTANTALAAIVTEIAKSTFIPVKATGSTVAGVSHEVKSVKLNLKKLIGNLDQIKEYYYYAGSQTVQPCTENVKWIIPTNKIMITEANRAKFSAVNAKHGSTTLKLAPNNRPVQTKHTLSVMMRKDTSLKKSNRYKEAATILGSTLLGIGTFGTVLNILNNDATSKALKSNPILDLIEDFDEKFLGGGEQQPAQQQFQPQQFQQRY